MEPDPARRVVVTGLGAVSSIGIGRAAFWEALLAGRSGVGPVEAFGQRGWIGAPVRSFEPARFLDGERVAEYGRASQLAIGATRLGLEDAGLSASEARARGALVLVGTTMGECDVEHEVATAWAENGARGLDRAALGRAGFHVLATSICRELGLDEGGVCFPTACAAGNYAIGHAYDEIVLGRTTLALAGGTDALSQMALAGFSRLLALAPERCQPFDRNRKGIVVGEGAGMLVLESLAAARARGARIYAEVLGYGLSCDAHHMTIPHVDGIEAVMKRALRAARVAPDGVTLVNAHGTGTPANDRTESEAIARVLGDRARRTPVHSVKSMLGHSMGAASALEAISCALSIHEGKIPPTINHETPDPDCPVDCVPNVAREAKLDVVINNAFAFGNNNAAVVFARVR